MHIKLIFKQKINNKHMYSPRLYSVQIPRLLCTVYSTYSTRLQFGIPYTHYFGTDTHT